MRQRWWLSLWLLLGGMAAPALGQVKLAWKLKDGDVFYLEEKSAARQTMKFMGSDIKHALDHTRVTRFTVLKKNDDNSYLLEQRILLVRLNRPSDAARADARLVQGLEGATFKVTLDPRMRVTRFEGYDALIKKMAGKDTVARNLRALMPEESLRRPTEALFGCLPDKAVEKGDSWTCTVIKPLGVLGVLRLESSSTFQKTETVEGQEAVKVEVAATKSTFTPSTTTGLSFRVVKGNIKVDQSSTSGTLYFNAARGRLVKSTQTIHLTGRLTVDAMGNLLNLDVEQEDTVTARVLDKNPLEKESR